MRIGILRALSASFALRWFARLILILRILVEESLFDLL